MLDFKPEASIDLTMEELGSHVWELDPVHVQYWIRHFCFSMEIVEKQTPFLMTVHHDLGKFQRVIHFSTEVTPEIRRTYANDQVRIERTAEAIALLTAPSLTNHTVVRVSPADGGGFDFWVFPADELADYDDMLIFNDPRGKRLEVSGLERSKGLSTVRTRVRQKHDRIRHAGDPAGSIVYVVEFSEAKAILESA